jgi:hypothetical protein
MEVLLQLLWLWHRLAYIAKTLPSGIELGFALRPPVFHDDVSITAVGVDVQFVGVIDRYGICTCSGLDDAAHAPHGLALLRARRERPHSRRAAERG